MKRVFAQQQARVTFVVLSVLMISGFIGLSSSPIARADPADSITVSPNYNAITPLREVSRGRFFDDTSAPPDKTKTISHVLKNENSSTILKLKTAAYFSTPSAATEFAITHIGTPDRCKIYDPGGRFNNKTYITVTLSYTTTDGVTHSQNSDIRKGDICKIDRIGSGQYDVAGSSSINRFFTNYKVPADFANAQRDVDTGMYKVNIVIAYADNIAKGDSSHQQQISFQLKLKDCSPSDAACLRFLSTVQIKEGPIGDDRDDDTTDRNYSTLRGDLNDGGFATTQRFSFGLPCSVNRELRKKLSIYDVDNGAYFASSGFRTGFYIEKFNPNTNRWESASYSYTNTGEIRNIEYGEWKKDVNFGDGHREKYGVQPFDKSDRSTSVTVVMQPHTRYRVTIRPVKTTNLLGIGLPTETIFGDLDCNVRLDGSIGANPADNPLNAGRKVSLTARANRTGNVALTSQYNYLFQTWYDNGDGKFNAPGQTGETEACPLKTGSETQTGIGSRDLATCDDILSDPSRNSGNVTAICSRLVLFATEGITTIGTGKAPDGVTKCIQIGKRPYLAVLNGDVFAGGTAGSNPCTVTNSAIVSSNYVGIPGADGIIKNYSSYATYGVTSLGSSKAFASNGLRAFDPTSAALVFSNTVTPSGLNGYFYNIANTTGLPAETRCLSDPFTDVGDRATDDGGNPGPLGIDLSTLISPTNLVVSRYYNITGTLTVRASLPIPPGARIIIRADHANIVIAGDIKYDDRPYTNTDVLPQVSLLSARNITINRDVTQVDGLLSAKGDVKTCDIDLPQLNTCDKPLAVNGAVVAGGLVRPLRTYGAELPDYGQVAETFSLRPDTWVSQLPTPTNPDVYMRTVTEREVPPRF